MGDFPLQHPNMPKQPTKPPDLVSNVIGQPSSVNPSPNTDPTPPQTGPTPSNSPPFVATLGISLSDAAATSNGDPPTGQPPLDAPPLGDPIGMSYGPQPLAPAILPSDALRRAMPAPSVPLAAIRYSPLSDATHSATFTSSHMVVPQVA
ncbi:hypothetical protein Adt_14526 [Abeliophyllum distichum]|uniref:Uncharacterized protein n=1 Tax=Abeliophyllum distichum TaxID=126358 RepID=A0ABD1TZW6_9LAMI